MNVSERAYMWCVFKNEIIPAIPKSKYNLLYEKKQKKELYGYSCSSTHLGPWNGVERNGHLNIIGHENFNL